MRKTQAVFIIGAGPMQVPAILEAKRLGLRVMASDGNPSAPGLALADRACYIDALDIDAHHEAAWALNPDGVFSGGDFAVTAAHVAALLRLPGIPPYVAHRTKNKRKTKAWLTEAKIPTPKLLDESGPFPLIVKPVDASASRGITLVHRQGDLRAAKEKACRASPLADCMLEEFVTGPEQSVEMCVDEHGHHWRLGIVDRFFDGVIELGHRNPSALSEANQEALYAITERAGRALGITRGPYKTDTILTEHGPMILEVAARCSGGWHSQKTTPLALGISPIRAALKLCVGWSTSAEDFTPKRARYAECHAVFPSHGTVTSVEVPTRHDVLGLEDVIMLAKPGDVIRHAENCADRVCYVITSGDTREMAWGAANLAVERVRINTCPIESSSRT